jgi:outer membrane protein assembly factor BamB
MDFAFEGFDSGFSGFDTEIEEVEVKKEKKFDRIWHIKDGGGSVYQQPAISDGIMYFGAMDSYVYALNAETGKEMWRAKLAGMVIGSSPAIRGNAIYVGCYDYRLYALEKKTGKTIWAFRTNGEIVSTPAITKERIYFCSSDGCAYCIDLEGKEIWKFRTGDKVASSPVVADGRMIFGSFDGNYYCLDAETGRELWRFRTGAEIWHMNPPAINGGKVYVSSFDNYAYCLDVKTGREVWRFRTGKYGNSSAPVWYDGLLYHGTRDGIIYCLTPEGREVWRFRGGEAMDCGIGYEGMFLCCNGDGFFYALDAKTGKELWRFRTGAMNYHFPAVWRERIFFSSMDCHIYAIDLRGKEMWRFMTSTQKASDIPPAYEAWKAEIKKTHVEDAISEDRYRAKKTDTVSLSDYHVASEYSAKSDYKQKSDYSATLTFFEDVFVENAHVTQLLHFEPLAETRIKKN